MHHSYFDYFVCPASVMAAGVWYHIDELYNKCVSDGGPAEWVKSMEKMKKIGMPADYKVTDEKVENGKPTVVLVTVNEGALGSQIKFYRSCDACKADAARAIRGQALN